MLSWKMEIVFIVGIGSIVYAFLEDGKDSLEVGWGPILEECEGNLI